MKRKGFIGDVGTYIIALFLMSMVFLIAYYAVNSINTSWQASPVGDDAKEIFGTNFADKFANIFDNVYFMIVVGYFIVMIILAFALRTQPALAFLVIFVLIVFGMVGVYFSNAFYDFSRTEGISAVAGDFTKMSWLATRLPHILVIAGFIFVIILYSKSRSDAGVAL